jgi:hypothetical protein
MYHWCDTAFNYVTGPQVSVLRLELKTCLKKIARVFVARDAKKSREDPPLRRNWLKKVVHRHDCIHLDHNGIAHSLFNAENGRRRAGSLLLL